MKTDREMAIKTLAKYLGQIKDRDVLIKSYEAAAPDNRISRKQYPYLAGLQMALDLLAEENPKPRAPNRKTLSTVVSSKNSMTVATSIISTRRSHDEAVNA